MTDYRYEYQDEQHKYYLLALSLLLHGCIILCFIIFEVQHEADIHFTDEPAHEPQSQQADSPFQQPVPPQAELTARSSDFGAPVIFEDDMQESQEESPQDTTPVEKKHEDQEPPKEAPEMVPMQSAPAPISAAQIQPSKVIKKRIRKQNPSANKTKSSPVKKELTFADLAAGFLQTIHRTRTQGNALISRRGDPNVAPTEQDLKYSSYMAKFQWYLEHSSRIHPFKPNPPISQDALMKILISIDKEGNVKAVQIVQTSGRIDLDAHIEKIITKASPFPELPEHFGTSLFTLPMTISIGRTDPRATNAEYIFASQ